MKKIPKWLMNILIGIILNSLKNTSIVQKIIVKLKSKKALVGRVGIFAFTVLAAVKYYKPELPIDDSVELLGMIFSWLAFEIGLDKAEIENIESQEFDPTKPVQIGDIELPSPESIGIIIKQSKKITSDEDN